MWLMSHRRFLFRAPGYRAAMRRSTSKPDSPKPSTLSLFEREMHEQVAAARAALDEASRRDDPLLLQAAASHLEGLVDLARRNGILIEAPATA